MAVYSCGTATSTIKVVQNGTNTTILSMPLSVGNAVTGRGFYSVTVFNGVDLQVEVGEVNFSLVDTGSGINGTVSQIHSHNTITNGTLVIDWLLDTSNPALFILSLSSSLVPNAGYPLLRFTVINLTPGRDIYFI